MGRPIELGKPGNLPAILELFLITQTTLEEWDRKEKSLIQYNYFRFICLIAIYWLLSPILADISPSSEIITLDTVSKEEIPELNKIIIQGSRFTSYTASAKTIKAKEFAGFHKDVGSVLNTVSGIMIRSTGGTGDYTDVSIRGSSSNMVQIYLDGIPLNTALGGSVDISKIPLNALQKITVYKGTAPLELMGKNAGGVINLTSEPGKEILSAIIEAGSFGYYKGGALLYKSGTIASQRISLDYVHSDNDYPYEYDPTPLDTNNNDDVENTMDNRHFTSLNTMYSNSINLDSSRHRILSQISFNYTDNGIFYYMTPGTNDGYVKNKTVSMVERYTGNLGKKIETSLEITGKYLQTDFQRKAPYFIGHEKKSESMFPYVQGQLTTLYVINDFLSCKGLVSGSYDGFSEKLLWNKNNTVTSNPYAHRLQARGGLEIETTIHDFIAARAKYALRYERDSSNGYFSSHGKFTLNPKRERSYHSSVESELRFKTPIGLVFTASGKFNTRNPSLYEKFGRTTTSCGNSCETNDSLYLEPEKRFECDFGVIYNHTFITTTLIGHMSSIDNKIKYIGNSQGILKPQNIDKVHGWGIEWDLLFVPFHWLSLSNSFTYMENIIHTNKVAGYDGKDEPLLPRLKNRFESIFKIKTIKIGHSFLYSSRYFIDSNNAFEVKTKPELNGFISWELFHHTTITYRIENYLDVRNYDYVDKPKPGRMHFFGLHLDLSNSKSLKNDG